MEAILQSNARLIRAIALFLCLMVVIYFVAVKIFDRINSVSDVSIEVNNKGGLIFKAARKNGEEVTERYAQLMLPSNKVWINTGIDVGEDEECIFKITGNVHLAINHLVNAVDKDEMPVIKWTGPDGSAWENIGDKRECADAKTKLLILPGSRIGNVVGYFYKNDDREISDSGFVNYFLQNRNGISKDVFTIGEKSVQPNDSKTTARLFLSVNDILLNFTNDAQKKLSEIAYEGRKGENNHENWLKLLQDAAYYRFWFDDNVGGFLVNITIRKKKS